MKAILVVADVGSAHETRVPIRDGWLVLVMSLRGILSEEARRDSTSSASRCRNEEPKKLEPTADRRRCVQVLVPNIIYTCMEMTQVAVHAYVHVTLILIILIVLLILCTCSYTCITCNA